MSTTLKALNQLERQHSNSMGADKPGSRIQASRGMNISAVWPGIRRSHRSKALIIVCLVGLCLTGLFVFLLKRPQSSSDTVVKNQNSPNQRLSLDGQTMVPLSATRESSQPKDLPPLPSGAQSLTAGSLPAIDGNRDFSDEKFSISDPQENISQWYGEELKLQAIVWSRHPSARKVFINNQMVYQGQIVGGYQLAAIGKESIIVSQGGNLWRLFLGR